MFLPFEHPRVTAGDDHLAVEVVGGLVELERPAGVTDVLHERGDIGRLHGAVTGHRAPDAIADLADCETLALRHGGTALRGGSQQHTVFVMDRVDMCRL